MTQSVKCNACGAMSTEPDFCSSCGTQLTPDSCVASPAVAGAGAPSPAAAAEHCPKCGAEREDPSSPFCGTCGYNFVTKQGGDVVVDDTPPPAPVNASTATSVPAASSVQSGPRLDLTVTVDFSKASAPKVRPSLSFSLFDEENLIGRKGTSVKQTVTIEDEAISKRHALIVRQPDGSFVVRDLNSTNGTSVNGRPMLAGADVPLKEGDVITMGEFTVITVSSIRHS